MSGEKGDQWRQKIKDVDELKELGENAEKGDVSSLRRLGFAFRNGLIGLGVDLAQAEDFLRQGAMKDDVLSMGALARCSSQREPICICWATRAADHVSDHGCFLLGYCFRAGSYGLPQDLEMAAKYFRKMASCSTKCAP